MKVKVALINPWDGIQVGSNNFTFNEFQDRFSQALDTLTKSDCCYLSRTLGAGMRSILRWKAGEVMSVSSNYMFDIIKWVEDGKRTEKIDDEDMIPWLN